MKTCPKCNTGMVHGNVVTNISIYGDEVKELFPLATYQKPYTPNETF